MDQERRALREGFVVGIIGFASVAVLYGALDLIAGRGLLYTVDLLGKSLFLGLRDPAVLLLPMEPEMMPIFWYNCVHLVASILIGVIVVGLVDRAHSQPALAPIALLTIVAGFVVTIGAVGMLTGAIRPVLPWWSIVVSNSLAVIAAGTYLLWRWPETWRSLSPFSRRRLDIAR